MSNVTDLNEEESNDLMAASLKDKMENWRDTVLSLDYTSEPIKQCIEDSRCTEYIDGIDGNNF